MGMLNLLFFCDNLGYHMKVKKYEEENDEQIVYYRGIFRSMGSTVYQD